MSMPKRSYGFGGYGYGQRKPLVNYHTSQNGDSVTTVVKEMTRMTVTEKPGYGAAAQKHGAFLEEVCEEDAGAGVYSHGGSAVQKGYGYEQKAASYGQQHGSEVVGSGYEYGSTLQQHEQKHGGFAEGQKTSSYQHHGSSDNFAGAGYVDDAAVQHDAAKNYTVKKHHGGYEQKAAYGQHLGAGYQQQQQHGDAGFGGYDASGFDEVDAGLLRHGTTGFQKNGYGAQKQHGGYSSSGHEGYGYADGQEVYYQLQGRDDALVKKAQHGYGGGQKAAYQQPQQGCDDGVAWYDALVKSRAATQKHGGAYGHKGYWHGAEAAGQEVHGGYSSSGHEGSQHHGGKMSSSVMVGGKHHGASAGAPTHQYKEEYKEGYKQGYCESEDESDCSEEESDCEEELALAAHAGHGGAGGAYGYQAYKQEGKLAGGNKFGTTRQHESYHSSTTTGGYSGGGYGGWGQRKNHSLF